MQRSVAAAAAAAAASAAAAQRRRRRKPHESWSLRPRVCVCTMVIAILTCLPLIESSSATAGNKFLWLSDLHLDPFYGTLDAAGGVGADCFQETTTNATKLGQLGCDAPYQLLRETLQQAASTATSSNNDDDDDDDDDDDETWFVIVTGDLCRHSTDRLDQPMEVTQAILSNVSHLLRESLGDTVSIVPSLGNNDVTPDYYLDTHETTPSAMLSMAAQGLDTLLESDEERATFVRGGYLARTMTSSRLVLSLNTLLYSTSHIPDDDSDDDDDDSDEDPLGQFEWLQEQLATACTSSENDNDNDNNNDNDNDNNNATREETTTTTIIYIIGHIPPAMGSYRHSQLWKDSYLRRYYSILQEHTLKKDGGDSSCTIAGQFFGHLHADEFRWIAAPTSGSGSITTHNKDYDDSTLPSTVVVDSQQWWPLWLASSVTPIYGSNPSYRWVSYEPSTGGLLDYDTFYLNLLGDDDDYDEDNESSPLIRWRQGPSFRDSYQLPDLSPQSVQSLVQRLNQSMGDPDSSLWQALVHRQHVFDLHNHNENGDKEPCQDGSCRRAWICTLTTITTEEYADCLETAGAGPVEVAWARLRPNSKQQLVEYVWIVVATVLALVLGLCLLWRFGARYLRRRHYRQQQSFEEEDGIVVDVVVEHDDNTLGARKISFATKKTTSTTGGGGCSSSPDNSYHQQEADLGVVPSASSSSSSSNLPSIA